jgi:type I restriction enzyme S subunit
VERLENDNETVFGIIPPNWNVLNVEDIAEVRGRIGWKGTTAKDHRVEGPILIRVTNISTSFKLDLNNIAHISKERYHESPEIIVQENDILLATSGIVGKVCLVENLFDMATINYGVNIIRCKARSVIPKFLFYFLCCDVIQKILMQKSYGGAQTNLSQGDIRKIPIILPSLSEQEMISSILSRIVELIEKTDLLIQKTQRLKNNVRQILLMRGIKHTKFKQTELGEMPEEWKIMRLEELCKIERGRFAHRPRDDPDLYGGEFPSVQTGDVAKSDGYITSFTQTLNQRGLSVSKLFPTGIIAVTMTANIGSVGITAFPTCFPDSVAAVFINSNTFLNTEFLATFLQLRKNFLRTMSTVNGQANINLKILKRLLIAIPSLTEQEKIVKMFSLISTKIRLLEDEQIRFSAIKSGLTQLLLSGKLRVKNYEKRNNYIT